MQGLQVSLLGQGRLEFDGQALTRLLAPKHQALVYVLAAEGRPWPRQGLATLLWGELDEEAARGNLRGALSRLRRWLPGVLDIDSREVALADDAVVRVDLRTLRAALDASQPHAARIAAAEAWRGPLLDGFDVGPAEAFEDWLATARQRARQDIVALRHDLLARAEAAGERDEAMAHARALLDVDDADESAHMALMRLLAAGGRRTAAIAQYEACRAALVQRLGARPSAVCYALYTRIHADEAGAERLAGEPGAAPAADAVAGQLPAEWGAAPEQAWSASTAMPLVGRQAELAVIAQRLADPACRWLTLVGAGGVGKTRLALAAAAAHGAAQRHGVLVLSGRDGAGGALLDAQTLLQQVLARVGVDRVQPGALLLVLDNLETVPAAGRFEPLLRERAPGVAVLATSRRRVGGGREWLFELGGLSLARRDPSRPGSSDAAQLFAAAARRLVPGFDLAADGETVERICALVGGLPLALEMAAHGVHLAGAAAVAERLAAGAPLADADRDDADRHRSLDLVMEDSWALLDAAERRAALRLAQLPGAFDSALAQAAGVDTAQLARLREQAWLQHDDGQDGSGSDGLLALHPLQQAWLQRQADATLVAEIHGAVQHWLAERLPQVPPLTPFGELDPGAPAPPLAGSPAASAPVLQAAAARLVADGDADALARWVDGATALLQRVDRQDEAAALIGEALRHPLLPAWRRAGWRLRRAELLDGHGAAAAALAERRLALVELGLPDVTADDAGWRSLGRAAAALALRRGWPRAGPERQAFRTLLIRGAIAAANALSFRPDPAPMMRMGLLAEVACRAGGAAPLVRRVGTAWGAASMGHCGVARRLSRPVTQSRRLPALGEQRMAALLSQGRIGLRLLLGDWDGLSEEIDDDVAQWQRLRAGRQEMETRSLGAKLAFYEGRLGEAWERFAQMSDLAARRPGEAWRAWGPIGQCEVGLCLGAVSDPQLHQLFVRASLLLTEMENIDAAYTLRRHGLAARLAWRRGDAESALDAVRAGAAAAARTRLFGFWAHEGLAGLGDTLVQLAAQGCLRHGAVPPVVAAAWSALAPALQAHVRRFPPGISLQQRAAGGMAVAEGRVEAGRRLLALAAERAERQGARVDLARACEAMAAAETGPQARETPARRAMALWQAMGARPLSASAGTDREFAVPGAC